MKNDDIPICLAVEDDLSEAVLRKIVNSTPGNFAICHCYKKYGFGYLKKNINGFNNAAKGTPFLILTDLDDSVCLQQKINEWLTSPKHHNLLFRIAVREVETWLLADVNNFSNYLSISKDLFQNDVENIAQPKEYVINLAKRSRKRDIREAIVPISSTAKQGPDYNSCLITFVNNCWNIENARANSRSLEKIISCISAFEPQWE